MNPLHKAIDLSRSGLTYGGPFGAVVVQGDEIVGEGFNLVVPRYDPTAHAEIVAIRQAGRYLKTHNLESCELYSSCEPCPMCLAAIIWAGIRKVYYAATRADAASAGFIDAEVARQLCLPLEARQIELVQALEPERVAAQTVLDAWKTLPDKRTY